MRKLALNRILISALLLSGLAFAQTPPVLPIEQEHRIVFENSNVRIYHALLSRDESTHFHLHAVDNVVVTLNDGKGVNELLGKAPVEFSAAAGAVSFSKAPYTHRIGNAGSSPLHFVSVEVKAETPNGGIASNLDHFPGYKLLLENERVKVYRVSLEPAQSTGMRPRTLPWISVAVSKNVASIEQTGRSLARLESEPGDHQWHGGVTAEAIENIGLSKYESIEIELK